MSEMQAPHGSDRLKCPLWKKLMSEVCHTCPLWTFVRMDDPRTGNTLDQWNCALAWAPILAIDLLRKQDRTTASVDKVANVLDEGLPALPTSGVLKLEGGRG